MYIIVSGVKVYLPTEHAENSSTHKISDTLTTDDFLSSHPQKVVLHSKFDGNKIKYAVK